LIHGHCGALGGPQEALLGVADTFMLGEGSVGIGGTLARGFAYGLLNVQVMFQHTGGTLTKAMALHMASVLPTATGHSVNLDDQYAEDITVERIPVVAGSSPVPDGPGLGCEVDEDALARLAANKPAESPRHVQILHLPGGPKVYGRSVPNVARLTGREEGTLRGIRLEEWVDDGSAEFQKVYERVGKESTFTE
jgi:hypothetical protein